MTEAYVGIGSNSGDREENIRKSVDLMGKKCRILKISSLYETEPLGYSNQGWFLNCAVKVTTSMSPEELLEFLQSIEKNLGRVRAIKNGPRTIDLDILFYGNIIINKNSLIVPHPRLQERLFVLEPLLDISPDFAHPIFNKSINELYAVADKSKIVRKISKNILLIK